MAYMVVTLEVSKLSGWLNADAPQNIHCMSVTLEVSKLSGWLNTKARCRGSKGGHTQCGPAEAAGGRGARTPRAGEGSTADMGAGHGEERT